MKVVSYLRVSTVKQGESGLGLEAQRDYIALAAKAKGWQIIAEFVEDEIHLMRLRELGCTNIQGYFYSRPLDADTCFAFLGQTHKAYGPLPAGREAASCS